MMAVVGVVDFENKPYIVGCEVADPVNSGRAFMHTLSGVI
jgi:hypothetical protein